jgi:hypothetical protein
MRQFGQLLALGLATIALASHAADPPRLTIIGAGATCADWMRWAFGFLSASAATAQLAARGGYPLARYDAAAIHSWLERRCRDRPEEPLSVALTRLIWLAVRVPP